MYRLKVRQIAESKGISRTKLSHLTEMQYETINGIWHDTQRDISLSDLYEVLPDE